MREALRLLVAASAGRCVRTGGGASTREDGRACTRSAGSPIAEAGAAAAAAAAAVRNPHVLGDMGGRVAAASGRRALRVAAKNCRRGGDRSPSGAQPPTWTRLECCFGGFL